MDFALVFEGLSVATGVLALIAAGGIKAALLFASWASRKVAVFFDSRTAANEVHQLQRDRGASCIDRNGEIHAGSAAPGTWVNPYRTDE